MDHDALKESIFLYHDGELPAAEKARVESHLAECRECSAALAAWRKASVEVFPRLEVEPSEEFVRGVMARIAEEPRAAGWWRAVRERFAVSAAPRWAWTGAAVLGLAASVLFSFPSRPATGELKAEAEYISDLMEGSTAGDGLGTSIENYLLQGEGE